VSVVHRGGSVAAVTVRNYWRIGERSAGVWNIDSLTRTAANADGAVSAHFNKCGK
jgi:hypothetical protein